MTTPQAPPSYDEQKLPDGPPVVPPPVHHTTTVVPMGTQQQYHGQTPIQYSQPSIQYMVAAPSPKPGFHGPHTFIVFVIVISVLSGMVNISSLAFGIPAIVCAILSASKKSNGQYPAAMKLSTAGVGLTIANIVYTLVIWGIIVWLITDYDTGAYYGTFLRSQCSTLRYSSSSGYYCTNDYYY